MIVHIKFFYQILFREQENGTRKSHQNWYELIRLYSQCKNMAKK